MNKRGFTLIELLAVILILAIILVIAVPKVLDIIDTNKEKVYENSIKSIEEAAIQYITAHPELLVDDDFTIELSTLCTNKYLDCPLVDARTNENITGSILATFNSNTNLYSYLFVSSLPNYTITNNISNITLSNLNNEVTPGSSYSTTLTPNNGAAIPKFLEIKEGTTTLTSDDYSYNQSTGVLTINEVSDNITIDIVEPTTLSYIGSTGTQYINTGYKAKSNTKAVFKYMPTSTSYSPWIALFGSKASNSNDDSFYVSTGNGKVSAFAGEVHILDNALPIASLTHTIGKVEEITMSIDEFNLTVDGVNTISTTNSTPGDFTNMGDLYIFGRNAGGSFNYGANIKFISLKIYENNILKHNFIPAIDPLNSTCVYDTVTNGYYYNEGSGSFTLPS